MTWGNEPAQLSLPEGKVQRDLGMKRAVNKSKTRNQAFLEAGAIAAENVVKAWHLTPRLGYQLRPQMEIPWDILRHGIETSMMEAGLWVPTKDDGHPLWGNLSRKITLTWEWRNTGRTVPSSKVTSHARRVSVLAYHGD